MNKMKTQTKSLFAKAHEAFWDAKAEKFIDESLNGFDREENIKNAFIGYVLNDWLWDINISLNGQANEVFDQQVRDIWGSYEEYDQWLLSSMLHPKKIIKQVKKIYKQNAEEITRLLGDDDPSYVTDFSADFLFTNGINVPNELHTD